MQAEDRCSGDRGGPSTAVLGASIYAYFLRCVKFLLLFLMYCRTRLQRTASYLG